MIARQLLRLYPRRWRQRYGDELLAMTGDTRLSTRQAFDLVAAAIDARLSRDVRRSTQRAQGARHERRMVMTATGGGICMVDKRAAFSRRDALISAAVMIATTIILVSAGSVLQRNGFETLGEMLKDVAFPMSTLTSLPLLWLKGQPWSVQIRLTGISILMLIAGAYIAAKI